MTFFVDVNEDGVLDPIDVPIGRATLLITGPNGFRQLVLTDASGRYAANVAVGDYIVELTGEGLSPELRYLTGRTVTVKVLGVDVVAEAVALPVAPPARELALTGSANQVLARTGMLLVAAGLGLLTLRRRLVRR